MAVGRVAKVKYRFSNSQPMIIVTCLPVLRNMISFIKSALRTLFAALQAVKRIRVHRVKRKLPLIKQKLQNSSPGCVRRFASERF